MVVQPGLCGVWSETPKTGFLTIRLIYWTSITFAAITLHTLIGISMLFTNRSMGGGGLTNNGCPDKTVLRGTLSNDHYHNIGFAT